jgi:alpha-glucosidase
MKMLLLASLRGNIFLYYGEELGLTQVDVPFGDLQDPEAIANWPRTLSRDGARTPMPWSAGAPNLGFSTARPWLPIGDDHGALAVDRQERDPHALLHWTRDTLALRKRHPALSTGDIRIVAADEAMLAIERRGGGETMLCVFNLTDTPRRWLPDEPDRWRPVAETATQGWHFDAYGALIAQGTGEAA